MTVLLTVLAIAAYGVAALLLLLRLRAQDGAPSAHRIGILVLAAVAAALHGWVLEAAIWQTQGLNLGLTQAFSLFTWQSVVLLWLVSLRRPLDNLGLALFPLAALALGLAFAVGGAGPTLVEARWTVQLHVVLSVLAYGVLTLATLQALVLAAQDRQLHRQRSGGWLRVVPPLQSMEQLLFELTGVGFFLLSLALLSGLIFVENLLAQHLAHKTFFSIAAWVFYAVLLWGHWRFGWRGRAVTRWTLGGYAALLLAYFGSKFVLEQVLRTHWV